VALLPFENLSGREEQGRRFDEAFLIALAKSGACEVVDMGQVESLLETLRIRATSSLSRAELMSVGDSLRVAYVMLGTILEAGTVRTSDGDTPASGASLRLLEVATGRIAWANLHVVTGDDRETVFGWGRERSAERLLARLADEMMRDFQRVGAAWRKRTAPGGATR
jgi:TolB-like protein